MAHVNMLRIRAPFGVNVEWYMATPDDAVLVEAQLLHVLMDMHRFADYFTAKDGRFKSHSTFVRHHFAPDSFLMEPYQIAFYTYWRDRACAANNLKHNYDYTEIYCGDWMLSTGRIRYHGEVIQPISPFTVVSYGGRQFPKCRFDETGTQCDIICLIAASMAVNGGTWCIEGVHD
jgi:hypothetical protein